MQEMAGTNQHWQGPGPHSPGTLQAATKPYAPYSSDLLDSDSTTADRFGDVSL